MKKALCLLLAALLLCTAAGCGSVFEETYYYEKPMTGELDRAEGTATELRNFSMLKTALTDMISRHEEHGEFRLNNYNGSPSEDLASACFEIKSNHPLGAYAVENISYDTSYVVSYYVASIYISYKRTAEEVQQIVYAFSQDEFDENLRRSMDGFAPQLVARLYSGTVDEDYIRRLVQQHYYDDPVALILEPQLTVTAYPLEGANRIYDVQFDYGIQQSVNMVLSVALHNRLHQAVEELTEQEPLYRALESAAYLSGLQTEGAAAGRYPETAYGALVEQNADSKGLALAYRALCAQLEIPCIVVEGMVRNLGMEPHFWNIITLDGDNYHVDISGFTRNPAGAFLCNDDAFWGTYIWETEDYPPCTGGLTYQDAARQPQAPEEEEQGTPSPPPESPAPTESPALPEETPTPTADPSGPAGDN